MSELILSTESLLVNSTSNAWPLLMKATLDTVAASSARIYRQTFEGWHRWCSQQGSDPLALYASPVSAYLTEQRVSASTRQRQLSALRKIARVLATLDYNTASRRAAYESLLLLRAPKGEAPAPHERSRRALKPAEVDKVLRVWEEKS